MAAIVKAFEAMEKRQHQQHRSRGAPQRRSTDSSEPSRRKSDDCASDVRGARQAHRKTSRSGSKDAKHVVEGRCAKDEEIRVDEDFKEDALSDQARNHVTTSDSYEHRMSPPIKKEVDAVTSSNHDALDSKPDSPKSESDSVDDDDVEDVKVYRRQTLGRAAKLPKTEPTTNNKLNNKHKKTRVRLELKFESISCRSSRDGLVSISVLNFSPEHITCS